MPDDYGRLFIGPDGMTRSDHGRPAIVVDGPIIDHLDGTADWQWATNLLVVIHPGDPLHYTVVTDA